MGSRSAEPLTDSGRIGPRAPPSTLRYVTLPEFPAGELLTPDDDALPPGYQAERAVITAKAETGGKLSAIILALKAGYIGGRKHLGITSYVKLTPTD